MSDIKRYTTPTLHGKCVGYKPAMEYSETGEYVTHASHVEIVRGLEAQLDALRTMQKQKVFKPNFKWLVENADKVRDAVESFHAERVKSPFVVITDEVSLQPALKVHPIDEVIPSVIQPRAFCTEAKGECFTAGKIYDISTDSHDSIRICGDNLVSDLDEFDWWHAYRVRGCRGVFAINGGLNSARFQIVAE